MRSRKSWLVLAALTALLVAMPCGHAEPRDGWSLEARIPADALAMVTIEDVGGMGARFERTAIAGLFREPEMQAFTQPIVEQIEQMLGAREGGPFGDATPLVMALLEQLQGLRGQVAVALLDVVPGQDMPRAVMSMDFGENVGEFAAFLEGLRKEIDPEGEGISAFEKNGRTWWQLKDGPPISATTVDTAFVLATDDALLEGVVTGGLANHMGASEDFVSVRTRAGGDALALFLYANVPAIVERFGSEMPRDARRIANALGLDTVKAAAYGMAFAGDGFMDSFIVHAPGADHGLIPLIQMPPYEPRALPMVPAGAFYYEEGAVNWSSLLPNIRTLVSSIESNAVEEMDGFLQQLDRGLGVSLEDDVLAGLAGGGAGYVTLPETGGLFPELAIMMQVKDPAGMEQTLQKLTVGVAGMLTEEGDVIAAPRTLEYRGTRLHMLELQAARGDDVVPFTPTWTMLGDWWVITLVPHTMKEVVLRASEQIPGPRLADQEDFRSLREVMPSGAGEMTYVDLQAILALLYDTGVPLLQTAAKPNVMGREVPFKLDWAMLPAARTVRPYFRSLGVFTTWNQDGISIQMHGPIPLAGVAMVAAAVAVPFLMARGAMEPREAVRVMPPLRAPQPARDGKGPAIGVGPVPPPAMGPQQRMARQRADDIASFVRVFVLMHNRLPKTLDEMVEQDVATKLPKDPWERAYRIEVKDAQTKKFVVRSAGPDGSFDTEDDVTSSE